ncbi:MAG: LysR family transcriptional regulator [Oscillospiraceae bacterium]
MDIQRLEEFTVLARSRSFQQAAAELGISPALLSNHLAALEKKLGVRLMERSAHRFELSEAGRRFLADAREIVGEYHQILSSMGTESESEYRSLKIGMSGFIIPSKLGPYLDTVNLRYPNIALEILDDRSRSIPDGLADGSYDVFFTYAPESLSFPGVEKEFVYSTRVQVLVPLNHHLAGKSVISARELDGERFILYPVTAETAMRDCERELLESTGISYQIYGGSVCPSAYYIMVPVGKGLVLCPWVLRHMVPPNSTALSVSDPQFVFSMYLFYRKDCPNPYLPEFLEGLRNFDNKRMD